MTDQYFLRQTVGLVFLARFLSTLFLIFYDRSSYDQLSKKTRRRLVQRAIEMRDAFIRAWPLSKYDAKISKFDLDSKLSHDISDIFSNASLIYVLVLAGLVFLARFLPTTFLVFLCSF